MKNTLLLKAAMAAAVLLNNPLIAAEAAKEPTTKPTMGKKLDDTAITTQVKAALLLHRSTSAIRTEITTTNGIVVVTGIAKNSAEKELVNKVVEDIDGVKSVVNKMIVK